MDRNLKKITILLFVLTLCILCRYKTVSYAAEHTNEYDFRTFEGLKSYYTDYVDEFKVLPGEYQDHIIEEKLMEMGKARNINEDPNP